MLCGKMFIKDYKKPRKLCGKECIKKYHENRKNSSYYKDIGTIGGINSIKSHANRSKNEIYFHELCKKTLSYCEILNNEPIFDGRDADVIIKNLKIAVSWNGIWHYKEIRAGMSLEKITERDNKKDKAIKNNGFLHYIIKDMGAYNTKFVEKKFDEFLNYIYFI